jgi:hypothetical protein
VNGLREAAAADTALYRWSPVPQGVIPIAAYLKPAVLWRDAGTTFPFAI